MSIRITRGSCNRRGLEPGAAVVLSNPVGRYGARFATADRWSVYENGAFIVMARRGRAVHPSLWSAVAPLWEINPPTPAWRCQGTRSVTS
ncbi:hypothetical protein Lesp01_50940 [Lentzea sp. NBRC 102530]|nr:hypothetical protein Lesp01_50940 [Lentzea sp. NBRC 102530]